jgi:hypothetical protein
MYNLRDGSAVWTHIYKVRDKMLKAVINKKKYGNVKEIKIIKLSATKSGLATTATTREEFRPQFTVLLLI